MTQNRFAELCTEHCISPELALENDDIVQALKARDDAEIVRILAEGF